MPEISIITASYNYEDYIKETIESVVAQSYSNWEMIIIDDGSKDNSVEVIKSYCEKDNRIKLYQHENGQNRGLIETLKLGIEKSNAKWIVFLESDDTITPDYLDEKLKVITSYPDIKFIFNDVNLIGNEEYIKNIKAWHFDKIYEKLNKIQFPQNISNYFKNENMVFTFSAVMLKKEILEGLKYDAAVPKLLDYYLWTQLAYKYDFYYLNKKLTNWRIHETSYINQKTSPYKSVYFMDIQIADNLSAGKYKLWHRICSISKYLRAFKRTFIKLHLKDGEIILCGKIFKIGRKRIDNGK